MSLGAALAALVKVALLPPAGLLLLYAAGAWLARRRPRPGWRICHGAVALLYVLSTGAGSWLLVLPLESIEPVLDARAAPQAQAIVVLSAGRIKHSPEYGGSAVPDFVALERMSYAAHLARKTGLPLLVTGGLLSDQPDDEALATGMKRVFESSFGLQVRWSESASVNTAENASLSAPMLKRDGVTRILLVTDAMHMHRARALFEREGLVVTPAPTFFVSAPPFDLSDLVPTPEHMRRSRYALYEWLGLLRDRLE